MTQREKWLEEALLRFTKGGKFVCDHGRTMLESCTATKGWCQYDYVRAALAPDPSEEVPQTHRETICPQCGKRLIISLGAAYRVAPPPPRAPALQPGWKLVRDEPPTPSPAADFAFTDVGFPKIHSGTLQVPTPSPASPPDVCKRRFQDKHGRASICTKERGHSADCVGVLDGDTIGTPPVEPASEVASPSGEEIARGCHHNLAHDCPCACPPCIDSALASLRRDLQNPLHCSICKLLGRPQ